MDFSRYFEFAKGNTPVILSCPHGGYKKPKRIPDKTVGPRIPDKNTYFIAKLIISLLKVKNIRIFYILNKIHRSKVDLNRPSQSESSFNPTSIEAKTIYHSYQEILNDFAQECVSKYGRALIIDFHGYTKPYRKTLDLLEDSNKQDCKKYWGCSQLQTEISKYFKMDDGLALTEHNLSYSGGYITQQFFKKRQINALQIEVAKSIRLDFQLTETLVKAITNAIVNLISKQ
jgi:N-formylglutamate amidohydrolase